MADPNIFLDQVTNHFKLTHTTPESLVQNNVKTLILTISTSTVKLDLTNVCNNAYIATHLSWSNDVDSIPWSALISKS